MSRRCFSGNYMVIFGERRQYCLLWCTRFVMIIESTGEIQLCIFCRSKLFNFLCLLALIIHEVGQETKKIDNQPRSKSLNLNLILTSNISTEHSHDVWKLGISVVNFHCMEMRLMTSMLFIFGNDVIFICLYRQT